MPSVKLLAFCLMSIGLILQVLFLGHFGPLVTTLVFLLGGILLIYLTGMGGRHELNAFLLSFSTNLVSAGIASIYLVKFKDPHQLKSDANGFYELASAINSNLGLDQLNRATDGGGMVYIWREIYRIFHAFDLGPYIGITFNVFLVALTSVFAIKIVKAIYGRDGIRLNRMTYLFSFCGILWLYASLHLRDSIVLFTMTVLMYLWIKLLVRPRVIYGVLIAAASVAWVVLYKYIRVEYQYIPVVMTAIGMGTWVLCSRNYISRTVFAIVLLVSLALLALNYSYMVSLQDDVKFGKTWGSANSVSSLGEKYVVNAPLPVRAIIGTYYLHVYPIPFWGGFQLTTAYHLFKSLNVLYLFIVIPMGIVGAINLIGSNRKKRSPPVMFALLVYLAFSLIVTLTSLETRHLGAFIVALLTLAISPDFSQYRDRKRLNNWLSIWLSIIALVHIVWLVLKY